MAVKMEAMPRAMRQFLGLYDISTAAGYLEMTVYTLLGPLLLIMAAVVLGVRAVATPEENHTLELMLANPISRRRFFFERLATFTLEVVTLGVLPWLLQLGLRPALDMDIAVGNLTAASLALMMLALTFGSLALAVGAAAGRKAVALATAGGAAVAAYIVHGLGNQVESLRWARWLSPFEYYIGNDPLRTGFHAASVLVPLALIAIFAWAGVARFERRDLAA
jgi:ABC-2 type transport system permease protein